MVANRMETTQTAGSAKDDPDVDANNGNGNGNGEGKTKKKPSALLAWLPMIISMVAMPLLAYATTSFLLLPKLQQEQGSPAHAAAAAAQAREKAEEDEVNLSGDTARSAHFYSARAEKRAEAKLESIARHVVDSSDRTAFEAACARNPTLASIADEVERQLVTYRAQGGNPQRRFVARLILGERMEQRSGAAKTRQAKRAAADIQRQTARPGTARSDVQTGRKRQPRNRGPSPRHAEKIGEHTAGRRRRRRRR